MIPESFSHIAMDDKLIGGAITTAVLVGTGTFYIFWRRRTISFAINLLKTGKKVRAKVISNAVGTFLPLIANKVRQTRFTNFGFVYEFHDDLGQRKETTIAYAENIPTLELQGLKPGDALPVVYKLGDATVNYPEIFLQKAANGDVTVFSFCQVRTRTI